ncbi:MAG: hypothetical protein D6741_21470 [Planctomycetota bacterium]|nr:MAG: hypothetical protein D6741_21470 [Planctomycetota bacterium]
MVVVLDERMHTDVAWNRDVVQVNWLKRRRLVDMDEVEVGSASQVDVEHFCTQFLEDEDSFRQARKERVRCRILADSPIDQTAVDTLRRTFPGRVTDERR